MLKTELTRPEMTSWIVGNETRGRKPRSTAFAPLEAQTIRHSLCLNADDYSHTMMPNSSGGGWLAGWRPLPAGVATGTGGHSPECHCESGRWLMIPPRPHTGAV